MATAISTVTVTPLGLLELDRAQQLSPLGLGFESWLRFGTELGSPVGVSGFGPLLGVETGEATPGVALAALSLPLLGALELALVARAGVLELSSEAGQLRPAAGRALIDSERAGGGPTGGAGGEEAGKRPYFSLRTWPTRVSAARALAALRPDAVEPEPEEAPPSTVVYDLLPGAEPVLHRPRKGPEGSAHPAEAPPARPAGMWMREDTGELIAEYTPAGYEGVTVTLHVLRGTPAEIDRDAAAIIDALSTGKELPALE